MICWTLQCYLHWQCGIWGTYPVFNEVNDCLFQIDSRNTNVWCRNECLCYHARTSELWPILLTYGTRKGQWFAWPIVLATCELQLDTLYLPDIKKTSILDPFFSFFFSFLILSARLAYRCETDENCKDIVWFVVVDFIFSQITRKLTRRGGNHSIPSHRTFRCSWSLMTHPIKQDRFCA